MSTAGTTYASEPAFPLLAHSLLSRPGSAEEDQDQTESDPALPQDGLTPSASWSLKYDIDRGIVSSGNTSSVFRCGTVIGFSRLRKKGTDDHQHITQLPLHLLTKHLHKNPNPPSQTPTTFIIHPANHRAFAPTKLLAALLSRTHHNTALSREEAIKKLDSVQLLPVYDFRSAVDAINDVSESLRNPQAERATSPAEDTGAVLFLIAGLDTLAEGVIRASNPGKGAAVLTAALRALAQLARMHASFLSVLLVNTSGLGSVGSGLLVSPGKGGGNLEQAPGEESLRGRDEGVHSVFRRPGSVLLPSLLTRILDQGIDTHLLLSSVRDEFVVEVVKDRVGDGVGRWCIWPE